MNQSDSTAYFEGEPALITGHLLSRDRRVLLFGQPGIGKTTLTAGLAAQLSDLGRSVWCLSADPGSAVFGAPGAVCLAHWQKAGWSLEGLQALCSLDAARFRLPLVHELQSLGIEVAYIKASKKASRPGKMRRARHRTALWEHYLDGTEECTLPLHRLKLVGTPPRNAPEAWLGKQVAFLERDRTLAMGEVGCSG